MLNVSLALENQSLQDPNRIAVGMGDDALTFGEMDRQVNRAASLLLQLGVSKGDRVAALLLNGFPIVDLMFATARVGATFVPLNVRLTPQEVARQIAFSRARILVVQPELLPLLGEVSGIGTSITVLVSCGDGDRFPVYERERDRQPGAPVRIDVPDTDTGLLVYTSGTTGRPKGVLRSYRSNMMVGLLTAAQISLTHEDVGLAILPMFHVNSFWFVTLSIAVGAACRIYPHRQFHPVRLAEELTQRRITLSIFVPTMLQYLTEIVAQGGPRCADLRLILTSSAPLPPSLRDRLLDLFPKAELYDIYGATELGSVTIAKHGRGGVAGSIGYPMLGQRIRLLGDDGQDVVPGEVGELFVAGPTNMDGYDDEPEATAAAVRGDYVSVGDLARVDASGRIFLVDRKADMIITSAENVYPSEVENVLLQFPGVRFAAVVGLPDARRGEQLAAAVVPQENTDLRVGDLAAHCRLHLPDYKCPRLWRIVPELPLGPTGKVVRRVVRQEWPEKGALRA